MKKNMDDSFDILNIAEMIELNGGDTVPTVVTGTLFLGLADLIIDWFKRGGR